MPSNQDNPRSTNPVQQPRRDSNPGQDDRERGGERSSSMPERDQQGQSAGQPDDARNTGKPRRIDMDEDLDTEINTGTQSGTTRPDDPNRDPNRRNPVGRPGQQPNRPSTPD